MQTDRLAQQIQFIIEIDKLKSILRQTLLVDGSRRENSAEHSWHLALMAVLLIEYAPAGVDLLSAIKMLLIHDLVEIDAGDTFCYDLQGNETKAEREVQAANRLFGMLPSEQGAELKQIWHEFESQETVTAKFAAALDRLQPVLHNQQTKGGTWQLHNINREQVERRVKPIETGAPELWTFVQKLLDDCVAAGYLNPQEILPSVETTSVM
ncbi:MAG: HD domain-containing protein [Leptolyngbyaceae cyanobacterium RM2_2_4]|nr:HD domain-containing protein [Leptolyngbyaceae cyanobacterium SM1_4_3]NJN89657.1 HD domain-containing protein [Leptolyngbyaceae cyanobacterium SL_5_14]NJO48966.1 HD domain-containing protein [Leptolyngbyaceae cyanobacterium RM2_2_4]NJO66590.1 HD domain-containing protein [Leptolyngbyaceae cyanobacterium RM1_405_57]